jgi:mono/diheme cytochrome c family protein
MDRLTICGFAAMAAGLFSFPALAQDMQVGKGMFLERCAVCHGETGAGDDVVGGLFTQKPKDLQLLTKENNGEFLYARVYRSIDGRLDIAAHENSEMPIWGDYLMAEALEDRGINPKDAVSIVDARIISRVFYIAIL